MPELPEVETVANGVDARVRGQRIESVWLGTKPEPLKSSAEAITAMLTGSRIVKVYRVGKHVVVDLERHGAAVGQWLVHLGMTGRLLVCEAAVPLPAHTHAVAKLSSGKELRFVDPRRFGRLQVMPVEQKFTGGGKEPLTVTLEEFAALFRGRKTPIKAALLNQKLLHGVGNIYADESLFRAGVRPRRPAARLTRAELGKLHAGMKAVLKDAIRLGGSSVSDYVDADGVRGFFQMEHRVYLRTGQPCRECGTAIKRILIGGRGTHYCPQCQR